MLRTWDKEGVMVARRGGVEVGKRFREQEGEDVLGWVRGQVTHSPRQVRSKRQ